MFVNILLNEGRINRKEFKMISANNVTLRIGKKALFEDVNIKFTEGNCYGLIGANGAGKSTFLKILSGQLETTNGDIVITPGQRLRSEERRVGKERVSTCRYSSLPYH